MTGRRRSGVVGLLAGGLPTQPPSMNACRSAACEARDTRIGLTNDDLAALRNQAPPYIMRTGRESNRQGPHLTRVLSEATLSAPASEPVPFAAGRCGLGALLPLPEVPLLSGFARRCGDEP